MTFIFCVQALAEENPAIFQEALRDAIEQATKLKKEANKFIKENLVNDPFAYNFFENGPSKKGCPSQGLKGSTSTVKGCARNTTPPIPESVSLPGGATPQENTDRILVFVSFSMPEASLKSLAQEAQKVSTQRDVSQRVSTQEAAPQKHNVVLVMRGLYRDSFVKTAQKIQELGIAVDIHPELFEVHHVTSVPTFVRIEGSQPTHTLKGNVTLDFVVKTFEEQRVGEVP
jgi:Type-F conjugative transfer system pilin assembly protein